MNIEQIAKDNENRFKFKEEKSEEIKFKKGFAGVHKLLGIAEENKLNEDDTNKLIDAFEELGVEICFKTNKK